MGQCSQRVARHHHVMGFGGAGEKLFRILAGVANQEDFRLGCQSRILPAMSEPPEPRLAGPPRASVIIRVLPPPNNRCPGADAPFIFDRFVAIVVLTTVCVKYATFADRRILPTPQRRHHSYVRKLNRRVPNSGESTAPGTSAWSCDASQGACSRSPGDFVARASSP